MRDWNISIEFRDEKRYQSSDIKTSKFRDEISELRDLDIRVQRKEKIPELRDLNIRVERLKYQSLEKRYQSWEIKISEFRDEIAELRD